MVNKTNVKLSNITIVYNPRGIPIVCKYSKIPNTIISKISRLRHCSVKLLALIAVCELQSDHVFNRRLPLVNSTWEETSNPKGLRLPTSCSRALPLVPILSFHSGPQSHYSPASTLGAPHCVFKMSLFLQPFNEGKITLVDDLKKLKHLHSLTNYTSER